MSSSHARAPSLSRLDLVPTDAGIHARIIGSLSDLRPSWLVSSSLLEHRWEVATRGQAFRQRNTITLSFDAVVTPGGGRLSDPIHHGDLCTAKIVAYHLLQDLQEAATVYNELWALFWFFRWRLGIGIARTQDLTPAFFDKYVSLIAAHGRSGLVDLTARVQDLMRRHAAGEYQPRTRWRGRRLCLHSDSLAHELGVPGLSSIPARLRQELRKWFAGKGLPFPPLDSEPSPPRLQSNKAPGIGTVRAPLAVWQYLWDFRPYLLHDPLEFDPFAVDSLGDRIDAIAAPSRRTHTIPPLQACTLLDRALRWVTDYSPEILRLIRAVPPVLAAGSSRRAAPGLRKLIRSARFKGPAAPRIVPDRYWKLRGSPDDGMECLHLVAFRLLPAACAIVIAAFAARRNGEVVELQDNCLRRDDQGRPWLHTWIEKTVKDFATLPVPESVACAVRVLSELSSSGRPAGGGSRLFHFVTPHYGSPSRFDFKVAMQQFAEYCRIPPVPNEGPWGFKPHQLRRLFAVIYNHRFKYPSLRALSEFLQHGDTTHTRRYITESTRGEYSQMREEAESTYRNAKRLYFCETRISEREQDQQARAAWRHLPADWAEAVRSMQRTVDILSPTARVHGGTFNSLLRALRMPSRPRCAGR